MMGDIIEFPHSFLYDVENDELRRLTQEEVKQRAREREVARMLAWVEQRFAKDHNPNKPAA